MSSFSLQNCPFAIRMAFLCVLALQLGNDTDLSGNGTSVEALKCYQGQQNASMPVQGAAMDCPMASMSCIKSVDPSMNLASRACQTTNCTVRQLIATFTNLTSIPNTGANNPQMPVPISPNSPTNQNSPATPTNSAQQGSFSIGFAQVNNMVSATAVCQNATS